MQQVYRAGGALEQSPSRAREYLQGYRTDQRFSRQLFSARSDGMHQLLFRFALSAPLTSSIEDPVRVCRRIAQPDASSRTPFADYALLRMLPKYLAVHQRPGADGARQVLRPALNYSLV